MSSKEKSVLNSHILSKNLKHSRKREEILEVFLGSERHLTADELYRLIKKKYAGTGFATVYRTMKLLCECGLCREVKLEDGTSRYEHMYGHEHHDHLVCTRCGRFVEVLAPEIEDLQEKIARRRGFKVQRHRLEIYGVCRDCREKR